MAAYTHYEVVTLNQIIDVAATREPDIEIVPVTAAQQIVGPEQRLRVLDHHWVRRSLNEFAPPGQLRCSPARSGSLPKRCQCLPRYKLLIVRC